MTAWMLRLAGALFLFLPAPSNAAQNGVITLAEGNLRLLRGPAVLVAAEGVRIEPGDMLESDNRGLTVVEFGDGLRIGLGPDSRIYLPEGNARAKNAEPGQPIIVLAGWIKLEPGKPGPADGYRLLTPALGAATGEAKLLLHAGDQRASLFVESGSARLLEPDPSGKTAVGALLGAGQFASRVAAQRPAVQSRPEASFLATMPRTFRDALPARPDRLKADPKPPKADHDARYDEVKGWLQLPPSWRGEMPRRYAVRLRDPAFRKALAANLAQHPEWQPILYPPHPRIAGRDPPRRRDSTHTEPAQ